MGVVVGNQLVSFPRMFGSVKYVAQSLVEVLVRHHWLLPYGAYMLALLLSVINTDV
jgi:hypothetical protein